MKKNRVALALTLILLAFLASETVLAGPYGHGGYRGYGGSGGYGRFSVVVGAPIGFGFGYYGYYPPPYYSPYYSPYYAPVVSVPYTPPTYIEQGSPQAAPAPQAVPASQNYWYYCADSKSYYPYVNQCAGGWQRVSPTPPPG